MPLPVRTGRRSGRSDGTGPPGALAVGPIGWHASARARCAARPAAHGTAALGSVVGNERGTEVVQAYILIQTEVGQAADVAGRIRDIPGVISAEDVTGPYDVVVRAEANSVDELGKLVVARVQGVEGITRTLTCPVVNL
jgi:DNA-binding Lrp family transcriptional regulator